MADFLWLKVDKYLHKGVDMRGLTPLEKEGFQPTVRAGHASSKESEGERAHISETTVQDMAHHTHADPKEALPLFRLMTMSNPHFIPGYTTGAAMIARDHSEYRQAINFLREGEKNNPQSVEIETALGQMLTAKTREYDAALPHLQRAIVLGAAHNRNTMSDDEAEAYQNAYRWLVLNRREAGDRTAARRTAEEGLRLFPNDVVCRHFLAGNDAASRAAAPETAGVD